MSESNEGLLQSFCLFRTQIIVLFAICLVLFGLSVVGLRFVSPGSAGYVISVINVVTLAAFLLPMGALLWYCREEN